MGNDFLEDSDGFPGGFTVLMSTYAKDSPELLIKAIDSIYNNTLQPKKIIIIADGPISDDLYKILENAKNYFFETLELLYLPKNIGLANALNEGLKKVDTNWVVRADADDINLPHRFLRIADYIKNNPEVNLVGSYILEIDTDGNPIAIKTVPIHAKEILEYARRRSPFNHMSVAYKHSVISSAGNYPNIHLKEDYALWCKIISKNLNVGNISEALVHATTGVNMLKRRGGIKYIKSEFHMQCLLFKYKIKSPHLALIDFLLRSLFFMMPITIKKLIYIRFLRN
jgi:glycosyltransferase involved in cell wall biosynthesis